MSGFGGMLTFVIRGGLPAARRLPGERAGLRLRRVARRRGEPHRAPGHHDPRLGAEGDAGGARHRGRLHPRLGRHRGRRRTWSATWSAGSPRPARPDRSGLPPDPRGAGVARGRRPPRLLLGGGLFLGRRSSRLLVGVFVERLLEAADALPQAGADCGSLLAPNSTTTIARSAAGLRHPQSKHCVPLRDGALRSAWRTYQTGARRAPFLFVLVTATPARAGGPPAGRTAPGWAGALPRRRPPRRRGCRYGSSAILMPLPASTLSSPGPKSLSGSLSVTMGPDFTTPRYR